MGVVGCIGILLDVGPAPPGGHDSTLLRTQTSRGTIYLGPAAVPRSHRLQADTDCSDQITERDMPYG
ncbi:hypothetical protein GCM10023259_097090 [Thermocatellispora tengchongensis]